MTHPSMQTRWQEGRSRGFAVAIGAAGLLCFILLAILVHSGAGEPTALDRDLCAQIYQLRRDGLTAFLTAVTYLGNWQTVSLLCVLFLLLSPLRKKMGFPLASGALLSCFSYQILKAVFQRSRPEAALHLIPQGGYSFPSGHAMTALVFYGLMIYLIRSNEKISRPLANLATALLSLLILLIAFSRIYLGVHYPTDILAGFSMGALLLVLLTEFWRPRLNRMTDSRPLPAREINR